jgi:hypothetical protein
VSEIAELYPEQIAVIGTLIAGGPHKFEKPDAAETHNAVVRGMPTIARFICFNCDEPNLLQPAQKRV